MHLPTASSHRMIIFSWRTGVTRELAGPHTVVHPRVGGCVPIQRRDVAFHEAGAGPLLTPEPSLL